MQRIITQEEWRTLERGVLHLIELCENLKQANQRLEVENLQLREDCYRLQDLVDETENRLSPILDQLRAMETHT